ARALQAIVGPTNAVAIDGLDAARQPHRALLFGESQGVGDGCLRRGGREPLGVRSEKREEGRDELVVGGQGHGTCESGVCPSYRVPWCAKRDNEDGQQRLRSRTEPYDAQPRCLSPECGGGRCGDVGRREPTATGDFDGARAGDRAGNERAQGTGAHAAGDRADRKSTRLNSSHVKISYAVLCLKKKKATRQVA